MVFLWRAHRGSCLSQFDFSRSEHVSGSTFVQLIFLQHSVTVDLSLHHRTIHEACTPTRGVRLIDQRDSPSSALFQEKHSASQVRTASGRSSYFESTLVQFQELCCLHNYNSMQFPVCQQWQGRIATAEAFQYLTARHQPELFYFHE